MIAPKKLLIKIPYYLVGLISLDGVLYQNMVFLGVTFWVSISTLFLGLVGFIKKLVFSFFFFFSVEGDKKFQMRDSNELTSCRQETFLSDSEITETETQFVEGDKEFQMSDSNELTSCQQENFLSDSEIIETETETAEADEKESDAIELKKSGTDMEETSRLVFKFEYQTKTFEHYMKGGYKGEETDSLLDSMSSSPIRDNSETKPSKGVGSVNDNLEDLSLRVDDLRSDSVSNSIENKEFLLEEDFLQEKSANVKTDAEENLMQMPDSKTSSETRNDELHFLSENDFVETTDSDSGTIDSSLDFTSQFIASTSDGFFSDSDFEEELLEPEENAKHTEMDSDQEDDCNGLESLWEHQELIEQMKMELKKVKATGLPTILEEESECSLMMEDLKPWKIDEKKFQHVDTIGELHKFYKSYRDRMRKLDILNYQKMYALGLLQSKDPLQAISSVKTSPPPPTIGSVIASNFRLCKPRKAITDPMMKFVKELHSELEQVYVGQLCLSWEILHWQYVKAIELWESDAYGFRRYNEVAAEFQQFQVLMQRFLENEEFEGPRVQNYVKKRCVLRNLLQVPVIREDSNKSRVRTSVAEDGADDVVTSDKVLETMEESIRLFWRFVRADKHANSTFQKTRTTSQIQPEDPQGMEMFAEIKADLQKKERRLKDVVRSGNCILRRFQKHQEEDESEQVLHFFSQVDMKLVTRVLNMSKLTRDHLLWCHSKLSKISFVNRRIHVEPSFCLFPC